MLIVFLLVIISLSISLFVSKFPDLEIIESKGRKINRPIFFTSLAICFAISGLIISIALDFSFESAIELDAVQEGVIVEYRSAIELYSDKAVLHIDQAMTDLKYQGYQEKMALMIIELRNTVTTHNRNLIYKRKRKETPIYSWLIIMPDNDRLIHIVEDGNK